MLVAGIDLIDLLIFKCYNNAMIAKVAELERFDFFVCAILYLNIIVYYLLMSDWMKKSNAI